MFLVCEYGSTVNHPITRLFLHIGMIFIILQHVGFYNYYHRFFTILCFLPYCLQKCFIEDLKKCRLHVYSVTCPLPLLNSIWSLVPFCSSGQSGPRTEPLGLTYHHTYGNIHSCLLVTLLNMTREDTKGDEFNVRTYREGVER